MNEKYSNFSLLKFQDTIMEVTMAIITVKTVYSQENLT